MTHHVIRRIAEYLIGQVRKRFLMTFARTMPKIKIKLKRESWIVVCLKVAVDDHFDEGWGFWDDNIMYVSPFLLISTSRSMSLYAHGKWHRARGDIIDNNMYHNSILF